MAQDDTSRQSTETTATATQVLQQGVRHDTSQPARRKESGTTGYDVDNIFFGAHVAVMCAHTCIRARVLRLHILQVDHAIENMSVNVARVTDNIANTEDLGEKAEILNQSSQQFNKQAKKVNAQKCMRNREP